MTSSQAGAIILDGGFGSTARDVFNKAIDGTPLWSSVLLDTDPEVVVKTHVAFLEAGAQIITTATYQGSYETFRQAGYDEPRAIQLMRTAVKLADEARERHGATKGGSRTKVQIALSLGPFGAALQPMQDFGGVYPPPYGPEAYSYSGQSRTTFAQEEVEQIAASTEALTAFHLERLEIFASDKDTWGKVDLLAFETIPLQREAVAIKEAVSRLHAKHSSLERKPWWISTVWPGGKLSEQSHPGGPSLSMESVVTTLLSETDSVSAPTGVGINCVGVEYLPALVEQLGNAVARLGQPERRWLVLYPNGPAKFDESSRCYVKTDSDVETELATLSNTSRGELRKGRWEKVVVGGCCMMSPEHVHLLSTRLAQIDTT